MLYLKSYKMFKRRLFKLYIFLFIFILTSCNTFHVAVSNIQIKDLSESSNNTILNDDNTISNDLFTLQLDYVDRITLKQEYFSIDTATGKSYHAVPEVKREPYVSVFRIIINNNSDKYINFPITKINFNLPEKTIHPYTFSSFMSRFPLHTYASKKYQSLLIINTLSERGSTKRFEQLKENIILRGNQKIQAFLIFDSIPEETINCSFLFSEISYLNETKTNYISMKINCKHSIERKKFKN